MDKVILKYEDNGSSRYDGKEYFELVSKVRRNEDVRGPLKVGERVTVKTKTRLWKAVIVNVNPDGLPKKTSNSS